VSKLASDIVNLCVEQKQKFCNNEENVTGMLAVILKLKELDLAKKILTLLSEPLDSRYNFDWHTQAKTAFGIPSLRIISLLKDLISTFGWQPLSKTMRSLVQSCPPKHHENMIMFLEECPGDVPKDELIVTMVQQAVNFAASGAKLTDESLMNVYLTIFTHPELCSQFVQPLLDTHTVETSRVLCPGFQNLQMLNKVMSCLKKKLGEQVKGNSFYQMTVTKLLEQLHKYSQEGRLNNDVEIAAVLHTFLLSLFP
jgi:hypothetical protein